MTFDTMLIAYPFFGATWFLDAWTMTTAFVTGQSPGAAKLDARIAHLFLPLLAAHWLASRKVAALLQARLPVPAITSAVRANRHAAVHLLPAPIRAHLDENTELFAQEERDDAAPPQRRRRRTLQQATRARLARDLHALEAAKLRAAKLTAPTSTRCTWWRCAHGEFS